MLLLHKLARLVSSGGRDAAGSQQPAACQDWLCAPAHCQLACKCSADSQLALQALATTTATATMAQRALLPLAQAWELPLALAAVRPCFLCCAGTQLVPVLCTPCFCVL